MDARRPSKQARSKEQNRRSPRRSAVGRVDALAAEFGLAVQMVMRRKHLSRRLVAKRLGIPRQSLEHVLQGRTCLCLQDILALSEAVCPKASERVRAE